MNADIDLDGRFLERHLLLAWVVVATVAAMTWLWPLLHWWAAIRQALEVK